MLRPSIHLQQKKTALSFYKTPFQSSYAIVENGDVQLNIWPSSCLGEFMLEELSCSTGFKRGHVITFVLYLDDR
jgi:hypothetical protein